MNELIKIKFWLTSMFICFSLLASFAQVAVYPAPEGVKSSNRYEVAVQQNGPQPAIIRLFKFTTRQ
jgi:hypothetical protein